jgi:hypothetical protein
MDETQRKQTNRTIIKMPETKVYKRHKLMEDNNKEMEKKSSFPPYLVLQKVLHT